MKCLNVVLASRDFYAKGYWCFFRQTRTGNGKCSYSSTFYHGIYSNPIVLPLKIAKKNQTPYPTFSQTPDLGFCISFCFLWSHLLWIMCSANFEHLAQIEGINQSKADRHRVMMSSWNHFCPQMDLISIILMRIGDGPSPNKFWNPSRTKVVASWIIPGY